MTRAFVISLVFLLGCGDDEGGTSSSAAPPPPRPAAKPRARGGKAPPTLRDGIKVEDRVPEAERATIRHEFRDLDFKGDPAGNENRDPFRSYVISQPGGVLDTGTGPALPQAPTIQCKPSQLVGTSYNIRDLRLVGIVTRGVRKYALFQDSSDYGHIVNRGDCLGREKAKVKDIGAGFVTLEILQEPIANQAPRPPEERSIPLYPNELKLGETDRQRGDRPTLTSPTMPTVGTDPVLPSDPVPAPVPPPPAP